VIFIETKPPFLRIKAGRLPRGPKEFNHHAFTFSGQILK
jgi:hypothetical protein